MKKKIRKILIIFLSLVFAFSLAMMLHQQQEYRTGEDIYALAEQIAAAPPSPSPTAPVQSPESTVPSSGAPTPEAPTSPATEPPPQPTSQPDVMHDIDLAALRAVNPDVIGWIRIPGTVLSYPLMQGDDNDYYLTHAWNGTAVSAGSIFMEHLCSPDLTDFNTIIYGHRMGNGTMFADLRFYNSLTHRNTNPYVYIKTADGTHCYEVFAAYEAPIRSATYSVDLRDDAAKQALIDFALASSVIRTGVIPQVTDRILTLSTCTGNGYESRWVVQALEISAPG